MCVKQETPHVKLKQSGVGDRHLVSSIFYFSIVYCGKKHILLLKKTLMEVTTLFGPYICYDGI